MRQPERLVQDAILEYLGYKGVLAIPINNSAPYSKRIGRYLKPTRFHVPGTSDIICCIKGRFIGIEVKQLKGRQTPNQRSFEERVIKEKGVYILARSVEDVIEGLKDI